MIFFIQCLGSEHVTCGTFKDLGPKCLKSQVCILGSVSPVQPRNQETVPVNGKMFCNGIGSKSETVSEALKVWIISSRMMLVLHRLPSDEQRRVFSSVSSGDGDVGR